MKIRVFAALALTIFLAAFVVACDDGSGDPELPVTAQNQVTPCSYCRAADEYTRAADEYARAANEYACPTHEDTRTAD